MTATSNAAAALPEISVGAIGVLREEFATVNRSESAAVLVRIRASKMVQLLDELIERRRKDADNAERTA